MKNTITKKEIREEIRGLTDGTKYRRVLRNCITMELMLNNIEHLPNINKEEHLIPIFWKKDISFLNAYNFEYGDMHIDSSLGKNFQ